MKSSWKPTILLALAVLGAQFRATTVRADLLGYWPFEDGAGSDVALDASGNDNHGVVMGDAEFVDDGRIGGAIDFGDFNNGAWVEITSAAEGAFDSILDTQSATVTFWMNRLGAPAVNQWTFDFDGGASSSDPVMGRQFSSHAPWGNNNIYLDTGGCCTSTQRINSDMGEASTDGEWHHLAYVRDVEDTRIYIDGVIHLESAPGAVTSPVSPIIRAGIGATADGSASHVGLIDEFAIWDEALEDDFILALAEGGAILSTREPPGDFNADGVVDVADFAILRDNFGGQFSREEAPDNGDFNGDLRVNLKDFAGFREVFNAVGGQAAASVPEPSTATLLGLASTMLLALRRRRYVTQINKGD